MTSDAHNSMACFRMFDLTEVSHFFFILVAQGPSLQRTCIVGTRKKPNGGCLNIYGSEIRQKGVISSDKSSFCTSHRSTPEVLKAYPLDDFEGNSNARTAIQSYCLDAYFSRVKRGTK